MNDIKSLLTNNMNPQARLMAETRGLQSKWDRTGLLEGLDGIEKANMSILLENQAKQLLDEATATGTNANSEQWAGVALPLVRRVFAEISAKEFVSVQPMNLPSGLIFYLDFKYGTNTGGFNTGSFPSLFGGKGIKLGSTDSPVNGLYGVGRYTYTINDITSSAFFAATGSPSSPTASLVTASASDLDFDSTYVVSGSTGYAVRASGSIYKITLVLGDNNSGSTNPASSFGVYSADLNAARSWNITATGANFYGSLNQFQNAYNTGSITSPQYTVTLFISASTGISSSTQLGTVTLNYTKQPTDSTRGDFEDRTGDGTGAPTIGIPEINLELKSEPIVAKTRKLKAVWTPELAQDLNAYHSIDAEAELTALLSEYVSMEIDLEILDMLINAAPGATTFAWSARVGTELTVGYDANGNVNAINATVDTQNRTAYVKSTWFQTLGNKIQRVSNKIHQLTLRGGANFLVCSPDVATILESIPGYVVNTDGDSSKFAMGVSRVGSFASRFQVYKNPYMVENVILVGFRGNNFLETGAVYAPYIPLVQTPLVYDPVNFTPRRGVLTRYAKKVIRPEFYGKIYVGDLDQV
jgi:Major capsid protein Gp23